MVEKIKNLFVITLDDGRQTYFDFADGNIYGMSGKIVQNFNAEAKRILKSEQNDDFLAMYFYERTLTWPYRDTLKKWPTSKSVPKRSRKNTTSVSGLLWVSTLVHAR